MRLQELLEKRRNPEKNITRQGHPGAVDYLASLGKARWGNMGVSMTNVAKLGINPGSKYDTPIGVYFYPATYYMETKLAGQQLDFQDSASYIQIFEIKGNILDTVEMDMSQYDESVQKLLSLVPQLSKTYSISGDDLYSRLSSIITNSKANAKVKTPAGRFWNVVYNLSTLLGDPSGRKKKPWSHPADDDEDDAYTVQPTKRIAAEKSTLIWNKLMRMLGYSAVIDEDAIVHENEPIQGVVFDPSKIVHLATIENRKSEKDYIKDPDTALDHALELNARFPKGEPIIATDAETAYEYIKKILKAPWPLAEPVLAKHPSYSVTYAYHFLGDPDARTWGERFQKSQD